MLKKIVKHAGFKWLLAAGGLGMAAGLPVAITSAPDWWTSLASGSDSSTESRATVHGHAGAVQAGGAPGSASAVVDQADALEIDAPRTTTATMAEVFRFDVTVRELMIRWPRISTSLPELNLQGYRVPLVTGPAETDLAGALTYYFNPQQQVQRIVFNGTTGDGRELVRLLRSRYGFTRRITRQPNLFVYEVPVRHGQARSALQLKLAPVLKSNAPHQRFLVTLVIERPLGKPLVARLLGDRR